MGKREIRRFGEVIAEMKSVARGECVAPCDAGETSYEPTSSKQLQTMQSVIHTPSFLADAKAAGVGKDELALIEAVIAADPLAGKPIAGTGGARTLKFGGNGKTGESRTIAYFAAQDVPLFLLALTAQDRPAKGQRVEIGQSDRAALRKTLRALADDYRKDLLAARQRSETKTLGTGTAKPPHKVAAKPQGKGKR